MRKQLLPPRTEAIFLLVIGDSTPESPTLNKWTTILPFIILHVFPKGLSSSPSIEKRPSLGKSVVLCF